MFELLIEYGFFVIVFVLIVMFYLLNNILTKKVYGTFLLVEGDTIRVPLYQTQTISNMIYLYSMEDDTFITQGKSIEELAANCLNHNKVKLAHVLHEDKRFWFIDGKIGDINSLKIT